MLYIAGEPIVSYVVSHGKMAMAKGAPGYLSKYDPEVSQLVLSKEATVDVSEIVVPEPEAHYGDMECGRIALSAPIYYGDSDTSFENGVGQYPQSGLPGEGKPILIGGHDGTFFAPLEQIVLGDIVSIATSYGQYEYEVIATKIAAAADTTAYDLAQTKEQLILYTCYPFGQMVGDRSDRYYVYCDRILDTGSATD